MALWRALRSVPTWALPVIVGVLVLLLPQLGIGFALTRQVMLACILALLIGGLNLSHGYAGELALGQAAMYAGGAYTAGILAKAGHTDILLHLVAGGAVALLVGLLTGIPGLRLGGWSLAMASFFLVLVLPDILSIFSDRTGGRNGLSGIMPPTLLGAPVSSERFYVLVVVVALLWVAFMRNYVTSRHGVALRVLKQSPVLASSLGISVYRKKLLAYAVGAVPAGLAGALFANVDLFIAPETFGFLLTTTVLAGSVLGGSASVYGAVVGAAIMQFAQYRATQFEEYALVFTGIFLVAGGVLLRSGLVGLFRGAVARLDRLAGIRGQQVEVTGETAIPPIKGATLRVADVSKAFGGNQALKNVSLEAVPGEVTAVIGPNGSGKTTLLNMVCGFYRTDSGEIFVGGESVHSRRPHEVARIGVARTFQTPNIPQGITVLEAVAAGRYTNHSVTMLSTALRLPSYRRTRADDIREAENALEIIGLGHLRDVEAVSLPLGNRRLLEVARALVAQPGVLLLDECASGLDEDEVERLAHLIRRIRDAGGTVILVEHNFQLVLALADRINVLALGHVISAGSPEEIEKDPRVASEYLGVPVETDVAETTTGESGEGR